MKYFIRHFLNFVIDTNLFGNFHALKGILQVRDPSESMYRKIM